MNGPMVALAIIVWYTHSNWSFIGEHMRHMGIVLRSRSAYKRTLTILDDRLGKIECFGAYKRHLSHGALIEYQVTHRGVRYLLTEVKILDMPLVWARDNFTFFHHVLELCDAFLPWDSHCESVFQLIYRMYRQPNYVNTAEAQKLFLYSFFQKVGVFPEEGEQSIEQWIEACINQHPVTLRTAGFVNELLA